MPGFLEVLAAPQASRIDAVFPPRIEFRHYVIELTRVRTCFVQASRNREGIARTTMNRGSSSFSAPYARRPRFPIQGLSLSSAGSTSRPALCVGLADGRMNSVVDGVPPQIKSDDGTSQEVEGAVSVRPAFTRRVVPLSLVFVSSGSATKQAIRKFAAESRPPEVLDLSGEDDLHGLDDIGVCSRRHCAEGETTKEATARPNERCRARVGDVNAVRFCPSRRSNPTESALLRREKGGHEEWRRAHRR